MHIFFLQAQLQEFEGESGKVSLVALDDRSLIALQGMYVFY